MEYQIQDLSLRLPDKGLAFPGEAPVSVRGPQSYVPGSFREFCYSLTMSTQAGTHIQGAHYFEEAGRPIYDYPLSRFEGPMLVIDCTLDWVITKETLLEVLPQGDLSNLIIVFRTDFVNRLVKLWLERNELFLADLEGKPGLTVEAANLLIARNAKLLGIDSTGFECYPTLDHLVNRLLCQNDILLLENLYHLESLPNEGAWLECFPLPIAHVEGTPCRAIAKVPVCPGWRQSPSTRHASSLSRPG